MIMTLRPLEFPDIRSHTHWFQAVITDGPSMGNETSLGQRYAIMRDWCWEHNSGVCHVNGNRSVFGFRDEASAMLFYMYWHNREV